VQARSIDHLIADMYVCKYECTCTAETDERTDDIGQYMCNEKYPNSPIKTSERRGTRQEVEDIHIHTHALKFSAGYPLYGTWWLGGKL